MKPWLGLILVLKVAAVLKLLPAAASVGLKPLWFSTAQLHHQHPVPYTLSLATLSPFQFATVIAYLLHSEFLKMRIVSEFIKECLLRWRKAKMRWSIDYCLTTTLSTIQISSFYSSPDPFRGDALPEEETSQTHLNGAVQVFLSSSST